MKGYTTKGVFVSNDGKWLSEDETEKILKGYLNSLHPNLNENNTDYLITSIIIFVLIALTFAIGYIYDFDIIFISSFTVLLLIGFIIFLYSKKKGKRSSEKEVEILDITYDENIFFLFESSDKSRVLISHDNKHGMSKDLAGTVFDDEEAIVQDILSANRILDEYDKPILTASNKSKINSDSAIYSFDAETDLRECLERIHNDLSSLKDINVSFSFVNDTSIHEFVEEYTKQFEDLNLKTNVKTDDLKKLNRLLNSQINFKKDLLELTNSIAKQFDLKVNNFSSYMEEMEAFRNKMILFSIEAAYYIFCPKCNRDFFEQKEFAEYQFNENAQTSFNYKKDCWECESCGSSITHPIPVPKIYQELIQPVVRQLLMEHHTEREKLYNDIENQKIGYVEKYRKEIREINRINSSEIEKIISSIANLEAEIEADKENLKYFHNLVEKQRSELDSALSSIDNVFQNIRIDTEKATEVSIKEMTRDMNAIWMDAEKSINQFAQIQRIADQKRDQQFQTIVKNSEKQTALAIETNIQLENISENTSKAAKSVEHIATVTQAEADRKGYDKSKNIGHKLKKLKNRVSTTITLGSELDRAKKDMKN